MGCHRHQGDEVPEHVGVLQVGHRVPLLGVDEVGEENRVTDEEDWSVVSDQIPVTLLSVELHSKPTRVPAMKLNKALFIVLPSCIGRPTLTTNCREADSEGCLLTNLKEPMVEDDECTCFSPC